MDVRTEVCMNCHEGSARMHWMDSAHDVEGLSCNDCHQIHVQRDPVLDKNRQIGVCFECHKAEQAKINLPSRHPIKEGQTVCSDCHNPHGSSTVADLNAPSLVEACVTCHKEKRGPFIFEHPPAAEDCSECHEPHGSAQPSLLVTRPPFLCQQCHLAAFHPSQLADGTGLPTGAPNRNLLGKSCLNCHSKVHGSNHPSGARLTR
ncbi:MAG: DmsE family decaheme c-type cytochrome [Pseudomonadales bacterium]|nr:DmsE family decaheme c-type cytochrome [Pseudomonadales bacterium]